MYMYILHICVRRKGQIKRLRIYICIQRNSRIYWKVMKKGRWRRRRRIEGFMGMFMNGRVVEVWIWSEGRRGLQKDLGRRWRSIIRFGYPKWISIIKRKKIIFEKVKSENEKNEERKNVVKSFFVGEIRARVQHVPRMKLPPLVCRTGWSFRYLSTVHHRNTFVGLKFGNHKTSTWPSPLVTLGEDFETK